MSINPIVIDFKYTDTDEQSANSNINMTKVKTQPWQIYLEKIEQKTPLLKSVKVKNKLSLYYQTTGIVTMAITWYISTEYTYI